MTTAEKYDVVIVGAGAIGASSAFHLAERVLRVAVVEARHGYAEGSTGLSFASVRAQWSDALNIEISWRSIQRWRDFESTYGFDVGYRPNGYLFLYDEEAWQRQQPAVELQRMFGVPVEVLDLDQAQKISRFEADGLSGATWCQADGQVDPHGATGAFLQLAKSCGARVHFNFPVDAVEAQPDGSWVVRSGERAVGGRFLINAAGGWAGELAALAGFDVPVAHSRRNIYATADGAVEGYLPMTVDFSTTVFLRSEGRRILFGGTKAGEPDGYNTRLDWDWLEELLKMAADRFPWLLDVPLDRAASWAGTYEMTPDHNMILGPEPDAPTWINACGLSGHGLMQAPELGRIVAEQIVDGQITAYDASPLAIERFRTGMPLPETVGMFF